jgi:hypothetical protein
MGAGVGGDFAYLSRGPSGPAAEAVDNQRAWRKKTSICIGRWAARYRNAGGGEEGDEATYASVCMCGYIDVKKPLKRDSKRDGRKKRSDW